MHSLSRTDLLFVIYLFIIYIYLFIYLFTSLYPRTSRLDMDPTTGNLPYSRPGSVCKKTLAPVWNEGFIFDIGVDSLLQLGTVLMDETQGHESRLYSCGRDWYGNPNAHPNPPPIERPLWCGRNVLQPE